jgi:hypothetical protein
MEFIEFVEFVESGEWHVGSQVRGAWFGTELP